MPTIRVRISDKEKAELRKDGKISVVVREVIALYLSSTKSRKVFGRLMELQRAQNVRSEPWQDVALIREDRLKH